MTVSLPNLTEIAERATRAVQSTTDGARVHAVRQIASGSSGLTYLADLDVHTGRDVVVIKVAPVGVEPIRNRDVLRQARILGHLANVPSVPVPHVLGCDPGAPVEVPPLFVMSMISGESYEPLMTLDQTTATDRQIERRALSAASMAAALHCVTLDGPCFVEEREMSLAAEVARWTHAFSTVDPQLREGSNDVHERLTATIPSRRTPAIVHGDWRLGNMLCVDALIKGVIDWEVWTISDPRLDLAWLLLFLSPGHPHAVRTAPLPSTSKLIATYERTAGQQVGDLTWFSALARYKHAAACALIVKNYNKLRRPGVNVSLLMESVPQLLRLARDLLT